MIHTISVIKIKSFALNRDTYLHYKFFRIISDIIIDKRDLTGKQGSAFGAFEYNSIVFYTVQVLLNDYHENKDVHRAFPAVRVFVQYKYLPDLMSEKCRHTVQSHFFQMFY